MDTIVPFIVFAPLILLILFLVRHARRIHRDAADKSVRTQQVDNLDPALVQAVLERDAHTCQSCGTQESVGVDFRGRTPSASREITADDLEARCTSCYLNQWATLRDNPDSSEERAGILPRFW